MSAGAALLANLALLLLGLLLLALSHTVRGPHVFDSSTGRRVQDNRWLNDGIPPAQVAEWAGNSVAVLLAVYARCIDGQLPDLNGD
jgi:hypothetical protein